MPIVQIQKINKEAIIAIWHITETVKTLQELLPKSQVTKDFLLLTIEKQQTEWLSSRLLLYMVAEYLGVAVQNIRKDEFGKPYLQTNLQEYAISISHAFPYAVIALHTQKNIGVDIELRSTKLEKIAKRMFHSEELQWATTLQDFALLWCAKEAMYKWYGKRGIDFRQHLRVIPTHTKHVGKFSFPDSSQHEYLELFSTEIADYQIVACY